MHIVKIAFCLFSSAVVYGIIKVKYDNLKRLHYDSHKSTVIPCDKYVLDKKWYEFGKTVIQIVD